MVELTFADDPIRRVDIAALRVHQRGMVGLLEARQVAGQFAGQPVVVGVQESEVGAACSRGASVAGRAFATVRLAEVADLVAEARCNLRGGVAGLVVHDNHLRLGPAWQALVERALNRVADEGHLVIGGDDRAENDAHLATATSACAPSTRSASNQ